MAKLAHFQNAGIGVALARETLDLHVPERGGGG
jgi:hypothetical protein